MRVEVVLAWPRQHDSRRVDLLVGATVEQALAASGFDQATLARVTGMAIHGERVSAETPVRDGDRVELLRPLQADPKEARRKRAELQRQRR
ncbi:MAG TPA: RnfH family protein [Xanthomonadaceae bacterium]|nr:RnfH family protein [Xanthomonadaceae bacterium]